MARWGFALLVASNLSKLPSIRADVGWAELLCIGIVVAAYFNLVGFPRVYVRTFRSGYRSREWDFDMRLYDEKGLTGDAPTGLGAGLVFTSTSGGPLTGTYVTQHLQKLLAAAGLPRIRFHDARHSFVSWAADAGVDVDTISKLVGHSSTAVTRKVYLTIFEQRKREAVDRLDPLFAAGR